MNRPTHEPTPGDLRFALPITSVYLAVSVFNVASHVPWRDELRWWQIAVVSPTFSEMRTNMQFEGTPWLWYGLIWLLTRLTTNFFAMQLLHVLVAAGTVFLFTWRAPFPRTVRLLFPFGYFAFFEYAVICRNYALVFLLVTAAAAVVALPRRRPILLGLVLVLLTQTALWGAGLAVVLLLAALLEWTYLEPPPLRPPWRYSVLSLGVVLGGCALCYLAALPGPGESFIARWPNDLGTGTKLMMTIGSVWNGWLPLPRLTRWFWNTNLLDDHLAARFFASCALLTVAALSLLQRPAALVLFIGGTAGLLSFTYFYFVGAVRHQGLLFVVLIAACRLGRTTTRVVVPWRRAALVAQWLEARQNYLLAALLGLQAVSGVGANIADHFLPFSASKQIADYLRRELPADVVLVGYDDYCTAPIGAYLGRPIYSVQMRTAPKFYFSQDDRVRHAVTVESLAAQVRNLQTQHQADVVLILSPHREEELSTWYDAHPDVPRWERLARFDDSTVADEGAVPYLARRPPGPQVGN